MPLFPDMAVADNGRLGKAMNYEGNKSLTGSSYSYIYKKSYWLEGLKTHSIAEDSIECCVLCSWNALKNST